MSSGKWRKRSVIAGACVAISLLVAAVLLFANGEGSASGLTMEEARGEVLNQYGGEIIESSAHNGGYLLRLKTEQGIYEVTVGGEKGKVDGIRLLERYDGGGGEAGPPSASPSSPTQTATPDTGSSATPTASLAPETSPTPPPSAPSATVKPPTSSPGGNPSSSASVHITKEKAASLALAKVAGKVTDVEKDDDDGVWYYYVDIETNDGREAEVQLNAASGTILSVSWDDDDDDDDD